MTINNGSNPPIKWLSLESGLDANCLCDVDLSVTPDPPVLELLGVHDEQVSLRWTAGFDRGFPVSSYDLEYKEEKGKKLTYSDDSLFPV